MVHICKRKAVERVPLAKFSPILPLVLAQDKDHWKTSTRFHELFTFPQRGWEAVQTCTPDFAFRLPQLVDLPYEEIQGTPEGVLALRSLKAEPMGELLHDLVWDHAVLTGVSREAVERFFRYVLSANVDTEAFRAKVNRQESKHLTQLAMTLADRFRQEGRQEGHQEGLQKGLEKGLYEGEVLSRRQALLEVLEVRFGSVPEGLGETLAAVSDLDRLRALHRTALTSPDLEAFASGL